MLNLLKQQIPQTFQIMFQTLKTLTKTFSLIDREKTLSLNLWITNYIFTALQRLNSLIRCQVSSRLSWFRFGQTFLLHRRNFGFYLVAKFGSSRRIRSLFADVELLVCSRQVEIVDWL